MGMRAALFHPTTGYSLPDAARTAELVAAAPAPRQRESLAPRIEAHSRDTWRRRAFYRGLNRMLFLAAAPGERLAVLQRLRPAAAPDRALLRRSPSRSPTRRILTGRPPIPMRRIRRAAVLDLSAPMPRSCARNPRRTLPAVDRPRFDQLPRGLAPVPGRDPRRRLAAVSPGAAAATTRSTGRIMAARCDAPTPLGAAVAAPPANDDGLRAPEQLRRLTCAVLASEAPDDPAFAFGSTCTSPPDRGALAQRPARGLLRWTSPGRQYDSSTTRSTTAERRRRESA